ncbi:MULTISPECIES: hypothetical protein [unclassified Clostridium]
MLHLEKVKIEDAHNIIEVRRLAYTDEDIRFGESKGEYLTNRG